MEERENIRERLKKHKLSYVWLIGQLALRGIVTDKTEMSSVISGTRNGTKADAIIELSIPSSKSILGEGVRFAWEGAPTSSLTFFNVSILSTFLPFGFG